MLSKEEKSRSDNSSILALKKPDMFDIGTISFEVTLHPPFSFWTKNMQKRVPLVLILLFPLISRINDYLALVGGNDSALLSFGVIGVLRIKRILFPAVYDA